MAPDPTLNTERHFWQRGITQVAGLDEAGRGPWAGPVTAAAVILPNDPHVPDILAGLRDSKKMTLRQRECLLPLICDVALAVGAGYATAAEIDRWGIVPATRLAMRRALSALVLAPQALIIDALTLPTLRLPQEAFPYADARSLSVAAASVVAKVSRDRWMASIAEPEYPGYGFAQHKGYGTRQHREALDRLGVCPLHRRTFKPIALRVRGLGLNLT